MSSRLRPMRASSLYLATLRVPLLLAALVLLACERGGAGERPAFAAQEATRLDASADAAPVVAERIVSLNPSLTAILLALGAEERLVGVDDFSAKTQPRVASLPRVGSLFSPGLESVVALQPDLVVLVPGVEQRAFRERIEALGIATLAFDNVRFDEVLANITGLGDVAGRPDEARARVDAILRTRASVAAAVSGKPPVRTVLVLQRDPLFVVGRGSFIDEMLRVAGGVNVAAEFDTAYPQIAVEWVIAAAPDVILDLSADAEGAPAFWSRWPTLPAVAGGRVMVVDPDLVTLPGPALDVSLLELARALHGESVALAAAAR